MDINCIHLKEKLRFHIKGGELQTSVVVKRCMGMPSATAGDNMNI